MPDDTAPAPRQRRSLRCILGYHKWVTRRNDGGEPYDECVRCGEASTYMPMGYGWQMRD